MQKICGFLPFHIVHRSDALPLRLFSDVLCTKRMMFSFVIYTIPGVQHGTDSERRHTRHSRPMKT